MVLLVMVLWLMRPLWIGVEGDVCNLCVELSPKVRLREGMDGGAAGGGVVKGRDDRSRDRSFKDCTVSAVLDGSIGLT